MGGRRKKIQLISVEGSLALLVAINILFIVDIELTLRRNKGDQNGDDKWGFRQVLALLLLIIPLRDAWGALQEIQEKLKGFQEKLQENSLKDTTLSAPYLNNHKLFACYGMIELVQFLLNVGNVGIGRSIVLDEVGGGSGTALCAACTNGKVKVVNALLGAGARLNVDDAKLESGKHLGAPLHVAVLMENEEMVNLLLNHNLKDADCKWEGVGTAVDVAR
ncbi:hypothetical protein B0H13DRAFT_1911626 [Mycena leptocephala]|nr:hypothetical protein B0H13DRAFT_1911626 [Mycena leptocephala]